MSKRYEKLNDAKKAILQDPVFLAANGFEVPAEVSSTSSGDKGDVAETPQKSATVGEQSSSSQASVPNQASQPAKQDETPLTVQENASQGEASDDTSGHPIPYNRFQKKVQETNKLRAEVDVLKKQLESFRAQAEGSKKFDHIVDRVSAKLGVQQKPANKEDWLADYFKDGDESSASSNNEKQANDPYAERFSTLEKQLHEFKLSQAQQKIVYELEQVKKDFPSLNTSTILKAYAQGHGTSLREVAEDLDDYEHQVEQRGVANYLKQNPNTSLPPGWPKSSAAPKNNSTQLETEKPKNVKEASAQALKYLQSMGT